MTQFNIQATQDFHIKATHTPAILARQSDHFYFPRVSLISGFFSTQCIYSSTQCYILATMCFSSPTHKSDHYHFATCPLKGGVKKDKDKGKKRSPSNSIRSYSSSAERLEKKFSHLSCNIGEGNPDNFIQKEEPLTIYPVHEMMIYNNNTFPKCPLLVVLNNNYYQISCFAHFKLLLCVLHKEYLDIDRASKPDKSVKITSYIQEARNLLPK